jgi:hypothetical protein
MAAVPSAPSEPQQALDLLSGLAVALGHDVDVDFLLAELASGVRRTLDADRVSLLLLDEAGRLSPALAVARQHNDDLWQRFRSMPPIALDALPGGRQALGKGRVLVIEDASTSALIPASWQRAFELDSLAIAPLLIDDVPGGLLAVEYSQSMPFSSTQLALLEGMAGLAGIALAARRRRSQAQRVETVSAAVRAMGGVHTTRAVAEHALAGLLEAAGLAHGLFALVDGDTLEVVAARGPELPEPGRYAVTVLPAELVASCRHAWADDPRALVSADLAGTSYTVLPVTASSRVTAFVVLPVASLPYDVAGELQLLADATATALQAVDVAADLDWHRRALTLLASPTAPVDSVVAGIRALLVDAGVDSPRVVVDKTAARTTGLAPAAGDVARQLTRWRRPDATPVAVRIGDETAVPLQADGHVVGALLSQSPLSSNASTGQLVSVLGDAVGRAIARQRTGELEHVAVDAASHAAVASRAYREAGQILGLLANHLHLDAAGSGRGTAAEALLGQARRLLRDATEVLAPEAAPQADLRTALVALGKQSYAHGGPDTLVRQLGRAPSVDAAVQVAVVRAVQRLLALLREARAVAAAVSIDVDIDVVVTVLADELVTATVEPAGSGVFAAARDARAWLSPVGGSLEISHGDPGHRFVVRAPAGAHQPAHTAQRGESTTARP